MKKGISMAMSTRPIKSNIETLRGTDMGFRFGNRVVALPCGGDIRRL